MRMYLKPANPDAGPWKLHSAAATCPVFTPVAHHQPAYHSLNVYCHKTSSFTPAKNAVCASLAELENHLGMGDKTVAEFVIDLAKQQSNVDTFKTEIATLRTGMSDALIERLWNIIQHLSGGGGAGGSKPASGMQLKARPDAAVPGLALQNTREYAHRLDEELRAEAGLKSKASTSQPELPLPPQLPSVPVTNGRRRSRSRSRERTRDRRDDDRDRRDRHRDRDGDRHRDRDRDRDRDRNGRSSRHDHRDSRHDRPDGRDERRRDRSRSCERGRRRSPMNGAAALPPPPPQMPEAPELGAIYQGKVSGIMEFGCFVEVEVRAAAGCRRNKEHHFLTSSMHLECCGIDV